MEIVIYRTKEISQKRIDSKNSKKKPFRREGKKRKEDNIRV
jgi:hypothetical protein